jgi:hypothetical protein
VLPVVIYLKIKNMKQLLNKIEEKQSELGHLREELNQLGKSQFNGLVGKFFSLSATEMIKVTDISYVDEISVNVECLTIYGGKNNGGRIEFRIADDRYLTFNDINEKRITEVTRERFIEFLYESFEVTKEFATEQI